MPLLCNGSNLESFSPSRGLRQGDPLPPYLCLLCMEHLTLRIHELIVNNRWKPISLSLGGPLVSHLLFANDDLLFCKATEEQARLVAATLDDFCLLQLF